MASMLFSSPSRVPLVSICFNCPRPRADALRGPAAIPNRHWARQVGTREWSAGPDPNQRMALALDDTSKVGIPASFREARYPSPATCS